MEKYISDAKIKKEMGLNVMLGVQQMLIDENSPDVYNTAKLAKELARLLRNQTVPIPRAISTSRVVI